MFIGDPCDEEAQPILCRLKDRDADARGSINRGRDADDAGGDFDGASIGAVCAQVELVAGAYVLIEMEESAGS